MNRLPSRGAIVGAAILLVSSGCAVGAGMGVMSTSIGPSSSSLGKNLASNGPVSTTHPYYELQVIDYTGFLLSFLTSTADTDISRRRAMEAARARGARAGDTVEYEVKRNAPVPGTRTELNLRYSPHVHFLFNGAEGIDERGLPVTYTSQTYFGFDLKNEFAPIHFGDSPLSLQFQVNGRIENFSSERVGTWGAGYEPDEFHADVYLGAALNYAVSPDLTVRVEGDFGIVSPFMVLLLDGSTLSHTLQVQATYQPHDLVYLRAYANWKRQNFLERGGNTLSAGASIGFGGF